MTAGQVAPRTAGRGAKRGRLTLCGVGFRVGHMILDAMVALQGATKRFHAGGPAWLSTMFPDIEDVADFKLNGRNRRYRYEDIVERLLEGVRRGENVVCATYGSATMGVWFAHTAVSRARAEGFPAQILPGISCVEALFADLNIEPAQPGCQISMAHDYLTVPSAFSTVLPLILMQPSMIDAMSDVQNPAGLERLAKQLAWRYDEFHEITLYTAGETHKARQLAVCNLPKAEVDNATTLLIPARGTNAINSVLLTAAALKLHAETTNNSTAMPKVGVRPMADDPLLQFLTEAEKSS
jgi:Tetrapyrrole (Corrin/Porphyrin) Methylases